MNPTIALVIFLISGGLGWILGYGVRSIQAKAVERRLELEDKARLQGQIDSLKASQRPTLNPPSDYYGRR